MTDHKFTDAEVIKALECCANADCLNCPRWSEEWYSGMCADFLPSVLDLIDRQKAEIAELEAECERQYEQAEADIRANLADGGTSCHWCADGHRAEAIKEFAERLKEWAYSGYSSRAIPECVFASVEQINDLVEEMTEEKTDEKIH